MQTKSWYALIYTRHLQDPKHQENQLQYPHYQFRYVGGLSTATCKHDWAFQTVYKISKQKTTTMLK